MSSPPVSSSICRNSAAPKKSESSACRCAPSSASRGINSTEPAVALGGSAGRLLGDAPQRGFKLADQELQFQLAKFSENGAGPSMDFRRPAGLVGHISAKRETRPVDH